MSASDKKIGQILVEKKLVTLSQLAEALAAQKVLVGKGQPALKLGQILVLMGVVKLPDLQEALRSQSFKASESRKIVEQAKEAMQMKEKLRESFAQFKDDSKPSEKPGGFLKNLFKKS